jgi:hypothetical protein
VNGITTRTTDNNNAATLLLRERVTCDNANELAYGKVLWLDDRVHAAEALFRGQPCIAIRPTLSGSAWLTAAGDSAARRDQLLQWLILQRDALAAAHPAIVAAQWGGCLDSLAAAVVVVELTQRWADVVADVRLGVAQRIRIAVNALEFVHYLNVFPRLADSAAARADNAAAVDGDGDDDFDDGDALGNVPDSAARDTVVLGMAPPELFSVSGDYFVKLALLKRLHVYRGSAYGNTVRCKLDADCRTHFFRTKHMLRELRESPPDDFNCNLATNRCHGLDWRTNLHVVCRELLAPLFGVTPDGNVAPPGARAPALPYPVRNGAANALRACLAQDPARRPYPRDLQNALVAMSDAALPLFFTPRNDIVSRDSAAATTSGVAGAAASNASSVSGMLADVRLDPHVVAQNRFKAPMTLNDWAFQFASGLRDQSLLSPPIQAIGTHNDQPWVSTPIAERESPHTVRTHSGSTYRLVGVPSCTRFARVELSAALCAKLQDGLPSNWRELFDAEWQRIFSTVAGKHFASQLNNSEAPPVRFELAELHDAFQPPPTPAPTVHFRLIPTQPPERKPHGKAVDVSSDGEIDDSTNESEGDEPVEADDDDDREGFGLPHNWNSGHNHEKVFVLGPTTTPAPERLTPPPRGAPPLAVGAARPPAAPTTTPASTLQLGSYCIASSAQLQAVTAPIEPSGGRFRVRVTLSRKPQRDARLLIAASFHEKPRIELFSSVVQVRNGRVEPMTQGAASTLKTSYATLDSLSFELQFSCLPRTCDINFVETIVDESGTPNVATTSIGRAVPQNSVQFSRDGIRVLAVVQEGESEPNIARVCIEDLRLPKTPPQ